MKELVFIAYAGMIRGAVAFGLVLKIDKSMPNRAVIVTTALCLVVFTTVVMGSTVSTLSRVFFGDLQKVNPDYDHYRKLSGDASHHEEILHPNVGKPVTFETSKQSRLKRFDVGVLKPFLIYKYERQASKFPRRKVT